MKLNCTVSIAKKQINVTQVHVMIENKISVWNLQSVSVRIPMHPIVCEVLMRLSAQLRGAHEAVSPVARCSRGCQPQVPSQLRGAHEAASLRCPASCEVLTRLPASGAQPVARCSRGCQPQVPSQLRGAHEAASLRCPASY